MSDETYFKEKWQLLQILRSTVEGLLTNGVSNVWNIYGGLNRLHNIMERIFQHGCRVYKQSGDPDFWVFVQGLNWLQPSLATSPSVHECNEYHINLPSRIVANKDLLWLYKSLEDHSLSQKLSWLLTDKEHLLSFLEPWAFLCQENLAEATLVCLRAVEKNQPALLTEIDPSLFLPNWSFYKNSPKRVHRRCSSYPVNMSTNSHLESTSENSDTSLAVSKKQLETATPFDSESSLKAWSSFPVLSDSYESSKVSNTAATSHSSKCTPDKKSQVTTVELSSVIKIDYPNTKNSTSSSGIKPKSFARRNKRMHQEKREQEKKKSSSGSSDTLNYEESTRFLPGSEVEQTVTDSVQIQKEERPKKKTYVAGSAPEFSGPWGLEIEGQKDIRTPKKSFIEDGGNSILPMATGYFPQPKEGQSLTSFLSSAQFARANAELDRENAHFSISEAMIAAIEQLKCNKQLRLADEAADESDEEINNLKQRIRLRRRQKQEERRKGGTWGKDLLSDGKTDTTTTDQSASPVSTSPGSSSDSISTHVDDLDTEDETNLLQLKHSGLTASKASLYSESKVHRSSSRQGNESGLTDSTVSAEGVALSLISRFSEKHLPRASELKWLVSEQDAPQRLLPLPKSWPVSPDEIEAEDRSNAISLRGTVDWAPPRSQIIFTPHPAPVRKILIAKQNYRCAGCGMKVAVEYANRFRYCEYLGRYFCTGCHANQVSLIPGKILSKWDFNRYPVSNFSYRLLDQMTFDPLFQVNDLNPLLYRRIKQLDRTRTLRMQLFFLKDFIFTCRFAVSLQDVLSKELGHIVNDPHVYSIQDFTQVKTGVLPVHLSKLVQDCCNHVLECMLCQANGFVCELCHLKDVIYPWELSKVVRCEKCGACYHTSCKSDLTKIECKRCHRLKARRASREESTAR